VRAAELAAVDAQDNVELRAWRTRFVDRAASLAGGQANGPRGKGRTYAHKHLPRTLALQPAT
jgi:hypothetical protein